MFSIEQQFRDPLLRFFLSHVANPEDALDMTQETLMKAVRSLDSVRIPEAIGSWVFSIARNTLISFYRKQQDMSPLDDSVASTIEDTRELDAAKRLDLAESELAMLDIIRQLPDTLRLTFLLKEIFHFDYGEIAELLNVKAASVRSRMYRAREIIISQAEKRGISL